MVATADSALVDLSEAMHAGRVAEGDNKLNVTFRLHPVKDEEETAKAGHPVFREVVFIRKVVPGDKNNIVDRPAYGEDYKRFARQYEAFRQGQAEGANGMPLAEWPQITRSEVETLAYFKVKTVEDLANLSDGAIAEVGPIRHLVNKAQAFLSAAKEAAPAARLAEALKAKDAEMETLRQQLKKQGEQLEQLAKQSAGKK